LRDVKLERVRGSPGRLRSPELVDEAIARDNLVRAGQQNGEKRPLSRSAERERTPSLDDLERSQDPELHGVSGGDGNTSPACPQQTLSGASALD
jgi:hypothetical protein